MEGRVEIENREKSEEKKLEARGEIENIEEQGDKVGGKRRN